MCLVESSPNPFHILLVVAAVIGIVVSLVEQKQKRRLFQFALLFGVIFGVIRVAIGALTTHGIENPLFTLPSFQMPRLLGGFQVGGSIEQIIVIPLAVESLVIFGIILVFAAFNALVNPDDVVDRLPRRAQPVALAIMIGLAFVPSMIDAYRETVLSARARAGVDVKLRWRPGLVLLPTLENALERAVSLAESMESRGFGHQGGLHRHKSVGVRCSNGDRIQVATLVAAGGLAVTYRAFSDGAARAALSWDGRSGSHPSFNILFAVLTLALLIPVVVPSRANACNAVTA